MKEIQKNCENITVSFHILFSLVHIWFSLGHTALLFSVSITQCITESYTVSFFSWTLEKSYLYLFRIRTDQSIIVSNSRNLILMQCPQQCIVSIQMLPNSFHTVYYSKFFKKSGIKHCIQLSYLFYCLYSIAVLQTFSHVKIDIFEG